MGTPLQWLFRVLVVLLIVCVRKLFLLRGTQPKIFIASKGVHDEVSLVRRSGIPPACVVVQLGGELGNHLGYIAEGLMTAWEMTEDYGLQANLILRHQEHPKWKRAQRDLKCFPELRDMNLTEGNTEAFSRAFEKLNKDREYRRAVKNLSGFVKYYGDHVDSKSQTSSCLDRPFYHVKTQATSTQRLSRYYTRLRDFFRIDGGDRCCKEVPQRNDTVFHLRNFKDELQLWKDLGYWEAGPKRVSLDLLQHINRGQSVAITTRWPRFAEPYAKVLRERGVEARVVEGQSGVQDFCFLLRTRREIVGVEESTYFRWASFLGNASRIHMYTVASISNRPAREFRKQQWENPRMASRFTHVVLNNVEDE